MKLTSRMIAPLHGSKLAVVLDQEFEELFLLSQTTLRDAINPKCTAAIILIPWAAPPTDDMRDDGPVHSFLCSATVLERLVSLYPLAQLDQLCFLLLKTILNGEIAVNQLLVRQLPCAAEHTERCRTREAAALLMAHRGKAEHLQTALSFLARSSDSCLHVRIGLDTDSLEDLHETMRRFRNFEFYQARRAPVGPYVIRQKLAERSPERFLVFHDSDDISCQDRFSRLRLELERTGCDLVGSHECRVDEIKEEVRAFRFPLNASEALRGGPAHALLHPTSMITRNSFQDVGGFSTNQIIGNDTQFLLRAYFQLQIRNADSFLYVRRKHPNALTVAPNTALGSPLRHRVEDPWRADFESIKIGRIGIHESTLRCESAAETHELIPLSSA